MAEQSQKLNTLSGALNISRHKSNLIGGLFNIWNTKRFRWGMLILLLFAPFSKFTYLLFPAKGFGQYIVNIGPIKLANTIEGQFNGWYYVYYANFAWSIGELLAPMLIILGVFLLFPQNYSLSYLIGLPFGYYLSLLIYRMFYVHDSNSFHNSFSLGITILFLVFGFILFRIIDRIFQNSRHYNISNNNRIRNIISRQDIGWNDKELILRQEVEDSMLGKNETNIKK